MVATNDLKNGMVIEYDGKLMQILEFMHVLQNKVAYVRVKMKVRGIEVLPKVHKYINICESKKNDLKLNKKWEKIKQNRGKSIKKAKSTMNWRCRLCFSFLNLKISYLVCTNMTKTNAIIRMEGE